MTAPEAPPAAPETPPAQPVPTPSPSSEKGFPENTPLTEMSDAQKAAYWQHYARKHESTVKEFKGLTPQQVAELQQENETLKTERLSAGEKAVKDAEKAAATAARAEAEAAYLPQIQQLQVKAVASSIISGDKLAAFMAVVNPAAFVGDDGAVDESKVMGHLTAMYGETTPQTSGPRWQNAGQFSQPPPSRGATAAAQAEQQLQKRFGKKPK